MVNESVMLRRFSVLQQLPDVPVSIQSHYADTLVLARRADQLARLYEHVRDDLMFSARALEAKLEQLWSPPEIAAARSRVTRG